MSRRLIPVIRVAFFCMFAAGLAQAQTQPVEEIVAVVEDRPILLSEVEEQFYVLAQQYQVDPADTLAGKELRGEILDQLINNELLFLEGVAQGFDVSEEELDTQVARAVDENIRLLQGEDAFKRELSKEGLTLDMFRARLREAARREGVIQRYVQREIRPLINITDDDVQAFYQENRTELPTKPRAVRIQDLFIEVRPDSVIATRALEKARDVRRQITEGLDFAEAARLFSDDPTGANGGLLEDRIQRGMLTPELEAVAFALPRGVTSEPVRTGFGWNLVQVEDKDPNGQWVQVRMILFEISISRSDIAAAELRAKAAREKVAKGMDFTEAIRKYSEDPVTRQKDGNIGWVSMQNFLGEMRDAIENLAVGDISQPVPGDNGYHILKILEEEKEREFQYEEIIEELRGYTFQTQLDEQLAKRMDDLEGKYFIERRVSW